MFPIFDRILRCDDPGGKFRMQLVTFWRNSNGSFLQIYVHTYFATAIH